MAHQPEPGALERRLAHPLEPLDEDVLGQQRHPRQPGGLRGPAAVSGTHFSAASWWLQGRRRVEQRRTSGM